MFAPTFEVIVAEFNTEQNSNYYNTWRSLNPNSPSYLKNSRFSDTRLSPIRYPVPCSERGVRPRSWEGVGDASRSAHFRPVGASSIEGSPLLSKE